LRFARFSIAVCAGCLLAQTPGAFEVASVKLIPPGESGLTFVSPSGSSAFTARNVTLQILISLAYGVDSDLVTGGLSWLESQQYDVNAKWEGDARLSYEQLRAPLQKLLAERFQLAVHKQTKEGSGYALIVAKGGPKLRETKGSSPHAYILKNGIDMMNESMDMLAGALRRPAHANVVNETGIKGSYDVKLNYAPEDEPNSNLPTLFTALREQLGLQLVSRKSPMEMVVVDRVEKVPAEN
jgi:uncharacterized protein (TIGR03435 family)